MNPLVSIVIPTFNQAKYLVEAIDSAKGQSYSPIEIWIVDNGSTDETPSILDAQIGVHWVRQENKGPSAARNRGAAEAKGEIIVFLDGDDVLRPGCVAQKVALLEEHPEAAIAVGAYWVVDAERRELSQESLPNTQGVVVELETMLAEMYGPTCGMAVHRVRFLEAGGFREDLRIAEDSELAIRLTHRWGCVYDAQALAEYRQAGVSLSRDWGLLYDSYKAMTEENQDLSGNRMGYWKIVYPAFRDRMVNLLFARPMKEKGVRAIPEMLGLMKGRPQLVGFFFYWLWRYLGNRLSVPRTDSSNDRESPAP